MPISYINSAMLSFPHPSEANHDGIVAVGGDLRPERLLLAYRNGIFPWYNEGDPIVWWSPDPRFVLYPEKLKIAKSMRTYFNNNKFEVTYDQNFQEVISNCATKKRVGQNGTWITREMMNAYIRLHKFGYAHSVEVWEKDELVGGLYGISIGKVFYGESMFSKKSNASKFGFISLVQKLKSRDFAIIDCQQETPFLGSLGAELIPRAAFLKTLLLNVDKETLVGNWQAKL